MVLLQVGWGGMEWTALGQYRQRWWAGGCECGSEPSDSIKCGGYLV